MSNKWFLQIMRIYLRVSLETAVVEWTLTFDTMFSNSSQDFFEWKDKDKNVTRYLKFD